MNWEPMWLSAFREDPSDDDVVSMNEFVRLCEPHLDDPMLVIAMFFQRQYSLFSERAEDFSRYAREIENASAAIHAKTREVSETGGTMLTKAKVWDNRLSQSAAMMGKLLEDLEKGRQVAASATKSLGAARRELQAETFFFRFDLKLLNAAGWIVALVVIAILAAILIREPGLSPENAAAILVAPADVDQLLEDQRNGDLQRLLRCADPVWSVQYGFCLPKPGSREFHGWHARDGAPDGPRRPS